eukprot:scaffold1249_cov243-Pinguiococcus_pyrenoidosus.AAC.2
MLMARKKRPPKNPNATCVGGTTLICASVASRGPSSGLLAVPPACLSSRKYGADRANGSTTLGTSPKDIDRGQCKLSTRGTASTTLSHAPNGLMASSTLR